MLDWHLQPAYLVFKDENPRQVWLPARSESVLSKQTPNSPMCCPFYGGQLASGDWARTLDQTEAYSSSIRRAQPTL